MARRKSKELKENEDDLLFYLEYWQEFPDTFRRVAEKEIAELENKIKNKKKRESPFGQTLIPLNLKYKIMEYTEMVDKVKVLAAQNRAAKTAEDKAEVRRQMDALKESDPKAFAVAVGYMAKTTEQKVKELTMAEKFGEISDMVSMAYIAKAYFGKSRSWLAHKMNGNIVNGKASQFTPDELVTLRGALQDMAQKFGSLSLAI